MARTRKSAAKAADADARHVHHEHCDPTLLEVLEAVEAIPRALKRLETSLMSKFTAKLDALEQAIADLVGRSDAEEAEDQAAIKARDDEIVALKEQIADLQKKIDEGGTDVDVERLDQLTARLNAALQAAGEDTVPSGGGEEPAPSE